MHYVKWTKHRGQDLDKQYSFLSDKQLQQLVNV